MKRSFYFLIIASLFSILTGCYTLEEAIFSALEEAGINPSQPFNDNDQSDSQSDNDKNTETDNPQDSEIADNGDDENDDSDEAYDTDDADDAEDSYADDPYEDDSDSEDEENREITIVNDTDITDPFFDSFSLPYLEELEEDSEYILTVEVLNRIADTWSIKLYIREYEGSEDYTVIDFSGDKTVRERILSTENYSDGDEIDYYWDINIPGDSTVFRYGDWDDGYLAVDIIEREDTDEEEE